jgi:threonine dehydratase
MKMAESGPHLGAIRLARAAIAGTVVRTPLVPAAALSAEAGREILLKLESLQPTGAFKLRGAANAIGRLSAGQRARGVGCCSTGNHGRAIAYAARRAGIRAVVALSALVPDNKVKAIEALGAEVRRVGESQDEAQVEIDRLVREEGLTDLPPFDHPDVIAGQGTIALELLEDRPDLAAIVVPLSGGGLISGIAVAAKALKPDIRIIGVSMEHGAAMHESLAAGKPVAVTEVASLADSLGGGIGLDNRYTFDLCRTLVDQTLLVTEAEIYRGMQALYREQRLVSEGAAAVGVAALLAGKLKLDGPTALIVSGHNIDADRFLGIACGEPVRVGDQIVKG